jgi:hypothetical protein
LTAAGGATSSAAATIVAREQRTQPATPGLRP